MGTWTYVSNLLIEPPEPQPNQQKMLPLTAPCKRSPWLKRLNILMLGVAVLGTVAFWKREPLLRAVLYNKPVHLDEAFHEAIAEADRVVIRRGGFDCCGPVNSDPVLFTVSGRAAVEQIALERV